MRTRDAVFISVVKFFVAAVAATVAAQGDALGVSSAHCIDTMLVFWGICSCCELGERVNRRRERGAGRFAAGCRTVRRCRARGLESDAH
jgi:hypothetical protein